MPIDLKYKITRGKLFGEEENIIKMYYDDNMTLREICNFYEYKETKFLKKLFINNGLVMRDRVESVIHPTIRKNNDDVVKLYIDGYSCTDLAKKYGVDHGTILNCLNRNGVKIRNFVEARTTDRVLEKDKKRRLHFSNEDVIYIISKHSDGESVMALSKEFGCDPLTMQRVLNRRGIQTRKVTDPQTEKTKNKIKKAVIERYGSYSVRNKIFQKKFQEKYGDGLTGAMQVENFFFKQQESGSRFKKAIVEGVEITYQGYELKGIYRLLSEGYSIHDIKIGRNQVPTFRYFYDGKKRVYYPDIYIPKDNRIIEIKSKWTYDNWLEQNLAKKDSVIDAGYLFDFYIMEK
jgi:transposase